MSWPRSCAGWTPTRSTRTRCRTSPACRAWRTAARPGCTCGRTRPGASSRARRHRPGPRPDGDLGDAGGPPAGVSMSEAGVVVHADPGLLAEAVAARLIVRLVDAQAGRGLASVVLTGGRIAAAVYRAV